MTTTDHASRLQNLPQTYSHYRPIQGDGNCGWRGEFCLFAVSPFRARATPHCSHLDLTGEVGVLKKPRETGAEAPKARHSSIDWQRNISGFGWSCANATRMRMRTRKGMSMGAVRLTASFQQQRLASPTSNTSSTMATTSSFSARLRVSRVSIHIYLTSAVMIGCSSRTWWTKPLPCLET